jgi:microcystin-dependent protein
MPISIESDPTLAQGYIKVNGTTAATLTASGIVSGGVPAGAILPFAMNSAPSGWLAADGTAVSRSTYAALFTAIGTTYGAGDGSTTFALPDLRGIFVRGTEQQTISGTTYGAAANLGTKQQDAFKSHAHAGVRRVTSDGQGGSAIAEIRAPATSSESTNATGDTETRPANIALLYCIKF